MDFALVGMIRRDAILFGIVSAEHLLAEGYYGLISLAVRQGNIWLSEVTVGMRANW